MEHSTRTTVTSSRFQESGLLLSRAQGGDDATRNLLIKKYTPFILRVSSSISKRFVRLGSDDEASIALIAFNEAITNYREEKGISFLSFAETVIRRRLIDYFRKESKAQKMIPLSAFDHYDEDGSDEAVNHLENQQATQFFYAEKEASDRRAEIVEYNRLLQEYGISFQELVRCSPKHEDARRRAIQVARLVAETPRHRDYLKLKGTLPLKALEREVGVSRKTMERQRKYIIAVAVLFMEKLDFLKAYIDKA
ncbi:RNA polymerase sigma factor SigI [Heliophilum fasciatum]|uniref:RNA polymerase sigma factor SigI n=1 Tax=Heliophilum fasciatum TaxID=35700 RepID=A0A4R2RK97_9FIRM|nr:RNA polymerase sigma factor SigI [Heliophilum fasciatum]MCW2278068.1 RNA polymerase sigma factor [Heliophilum fasciatum]TCP64312.1 RNA polymerase sigma factor [Heliophilum fasciatum]